MVGPLCQLPVYYIPSSSVILSTYSPKEGERERGERETQKKKTNIRSLIFDSGSNRRNMCRWFCGLECGRADAFLEREATMGLLQSILGKTGRRFIKRKDSDAGETGSISPLYFSSISSGLLIFSDYFEQNTEKRWFFTPFWYFTLIFLYSVGCFLVFPAFLYSCRCTFQWFQYSVCFIS